MNLKQLNIVHADDDADDCLFFKKALEELQPSTHLTTIRNGDELMIYLYENLEHLPDVLFLDLSMPRKNGFECLCEIKDNKRMKDIPVVMVSTSYPRDPNYEENMINRLFKIGAFHFIRKPEDFAKLKQAIHQTLTMVAEKNHLTNKGEICD
jgi:CheY-like chemotaxis protein